MATKNELAIELYKQNEGISNSAFIELLMTNLGMTKLGARTYCYNVRKQLGVEVTKRAPRAAKPKATKTEAKAKSGNTQIDKPRKITDRLMITKPRTLENSKHRAEVTEIKEAA